jgi:hypothetical protein
MHSTTPPPPAEISAKLIEWTRSSALRTVAEFHRRGLRERLLTLPVRVALVLMMVWRPIDGVTELARLVQRETLLWVPPFDVSAPALEQRLRCMPADWFRLVLEPVLPRIHEAWLRRQRPLPTAIAGARPRFSHLLVFDAATMDVLQRRVGGLRKPKKAEGTEKDPAPLAGRITALLHWDARLPWRVWDEADPAASEQNHGPQLLSAIPAGALVVFDMGYTHFQRFAQLTRAQVTWMTRAKKNLVDTLESVIAQSSTVRDPLIRIGQGEESQTVRLIERYFEGAWSRYLSHELDPVRLPAV